MAAGCEKKHYSWHKKKGFVVNCQNTPLELVNVDDITSLKSMKYERLMKTPSQEGMNCGVLSE